MRRTVRTWAGLLCLGLLVVSTGRGIAGDKKPATITPTPRLINKEGKPEPAWMKRHEGFVAIAKKGDVEVLLLGDSITDAWRGGGAKAAWSKHFAKRKAANFGIGGDRTEHVLWRIQNGELDGIQPKVVMLMIGTNNSGTNSAADISAGVKEIVKTIHQKAPEAKVLLLGIFPRGEKAGTPVREKLAQINKDLAEWSQGQKNVHYLDIGDKFLSEGGILTKNVMPDFLHLNERGYNIWGEAVEPSLRKLLNEKE